MSDSGFAGRLEQLAPKGSLRRRLAQRLLGAGRRPILVASMSRAGSSILYRSIRYSWAEARFGDKAEGLVSLISDYAWRLDQARFEPGVVYKTHDLAEAAPRDARLKVLFTYRKASDVALSIAQRRVRDGPKWFSRHEANMGASAGYAAFLRGDTLGLERQVDSWFAAEGLDLLGLHYDSIWSEGPQIEDFVGFRVAVPKRAKSSYAGVPPEEVELIRATYAPLDRKIAALPRMFRRSADGASAAARQAPT